MRKKLVHLICTIAIVFAIISSGCVAPPKETASAKPAAGTGTSAAAGINATCTTETMSYVTEETPFQTGTTAYTTYQAIPAVTPTPEEYVQIYGKTQTFAYNKTAFSFDLKNPPMLIEFTVWPTNNTGTIVIDSRSGGHSDQTVAYSYFSPDSWYQITIRNKTTGDIVLQDGFQNGYSQQADNRTLKLLTRGNFLIELGGNRVTASTNVSVKRSGNIVNMSG